MVGEEGVEEGPGGVVVVVRVLYFCFYIESSSSLATGPNGAFTGMLQNEVVSIHICMCYLLLFWYFLVFRCVVCLDSESLTQKLLVCSSL